MIRGPRTPAGWTAGRAVPLLVPLLAALVAACTAGPAANLDEGPAAAAATAPPVRAEASAPASPAPIPQPRTWDVGMLKDVVWITSGGDSQGFADWQREDRDGDERWFIDNANEHWEVRPALVIVGMRIRTQENANRFVIVTLLLLQDLAKREHLRTSDDLGALYVEMSKAAAAAPGTEVQREVGDYLLTFLRAAGANAWVFSVEPL